MYVGILCIYSTVLIKISVIHTLIKPDDMSCT